MSLGMLEALILAAVQGRVSPRAAGSDARRGAACALRVAGAPPRGAGARGAASMAVPGSQSAPAGPPPEAPALLPLFDIGANLLDPMFEGVYNGKRAHAPDLAAVLERAAAAGVRDLVVTAGSLADSRRALTLVRSLRGSSPVRLSCTVGVHPTRCGEFEHAGPDGCGPTTVSQLLELARDGMADGSVVAIGEIGLDFDRLNFCGREVQQRHFEAQLQLAADTGLPLFLHNRNTSGAFASTVRARAALVRAGGVVHSFDGGAEELAELLELGFHIGINGCSLRSEGNLRVAASVPLERLLLETDAPWCQIRPSHAGASHVATRFAEVKKEGWSAASCVKARNEPCHARQVLEVVAAIREQPAADVAAAASENARRLFYSERPARGTGS